MIIILYVALAIYLIIAGVVFGAVLLTSDLDRMLSGDRSFRGFRGWLIIAIVSATWLFWLTWYMVDRLRGRV